MIMVGQDGGLTFTPSSITAPVGSNITFMFMSKNHSVYQSTFADPCNLMPNGFAAQFFPIPQGETTFPTVTIAVTSNNPIWFFCPQTVPADHCQAGMVGAINPTPDKTFEQFQAIAKGEQPPPAASGSAAPAPSSAPGTAPGTAPGVAPPGVTSPTGTSGTTPTVPNGGGSVAAPSPTTGTTSSPAAPPSGSNAAVSQMKGAYTGIVVTVLGVFASLL
jgi:hypothetical protein